MSRVLPIALTAAEGPDRRSLMACMGGACIGVAFGWPPTAQACPPAVSSLSPPFEFWSFVIGVALMRLEVRRVWPDLLRIARL